MKKLLLLCLLALSTAIVSCTTETIETTTYAFGVTQYYSSSLNADLSTINKYLNQKGCPTSGSERILTLSSSSQAENDAQAEAKFNQIISKLNYTEIDALGLHYSTSFSYTLTCSTSSPEEKGKVIGTFVYPKP